MKTQMNLKKVALVLLAVVALISILFFTTSYNKQNELRRVADNERLKSEAMLAEKLMTQKDLDKAMNDLADLNQKRSQLEQEINDLNQKINSRDASIRNLRKENEQLESLKKNLAEMISKSEKMKNEMDYMAEKIDNLTNDKQNLENTISSLKKENSEMADNIKTMQDLNANNYLIEALKGRKGKLTVNARRTNKIQFAFDVPEISNSRLHFNIITPEGKTIDSRKDKQALVTVASSETDNPIASLKGGDGNSSKQKRVTFSYKPDKKLKSGIYSIEIFNNDVYLGTSQIKLR